MIKSIEDDIDSVIIEEFYDGRRTPSYAVKYFNDSIQNHPTTESCLSRGEFISLTSKSSELVRKPVACKTGAWTIEHQPFTTNRAHRYLADTEIPTEIKTHSLGKPTRSTLLKERMNSHYAKSYNSMTSFDQGNNIRRCCSSREDKNKDNLFKRNLGSKMGYGFLVGARYNTAHFLDLNSVRDKGLYVSKNNHNVVFTNSSGDHSVDSEVASPPNSPQSIHNDLLPVSNLIMLENTFIKKPRSRIKSNIHKTNKGIIEKSDDKIESIMTFRPHTTQNIQRNAHQKVLPIVIGSNMIHTNFIKTPNQSSSSLNISWTRTSINLHFVKQNRFLRNRFHDDNLVNKDPSSTTEHQELIPESTKYLQCTKLYQKEN